RPEDLDRRRAAGVRGPHAGRRRGGVERAALGVRAVRLGPVVEREIPTPHGPARVHVREVGGARAVLVLGHGAGGGVTAPDLQAAARVAGEERIEVALVEQPYRVAGRRTAAPAAQLDAAWLAVVAALGYELPLVAGGRSSGARVACRTAAETGAVG